MIRNSNINLMVVTEPKSLGSSIMYFITKGLQTLNTCRFPPLHRSSAAGRAPFSYHLAKKLVFKKVRKALGLDRCSKCYTGAAPITKDTLEFFLSLDIPLYELYGMSESTGPHTISLPGAFKLTRYISAFTWLSEISASCKSDFIKKTGSVG